MVVFRMHLLGSGISKKGYLSFSVGHFRRHSVSDYVTFYTYQCLCFQQGRISFIPWDSSRTEMLLPRAEWWQVMQILSILRGKEGCDWPALSFLRASHQKSGTGCVKVLSVLEFIQSWRHLKGKQVRDCIHRSHTWPEGAKGRDQYWVDCPWVESSDRFRHLTKRASSCGRMFLNFTSHSPKTFF